jgi:hypothetical protein
MEELLKKILSSLLKISDMKNVKKNKQEVIKLINAHIARDYKILPEEYKQMRKLIANAGFVDTHFKKMLEYVENIPEITSKTADEEVNYKFKHNLGNAMSITSESIPRIHNRMLKSINLIVKENTTEINM